MLVKCKGVLPLTTGPSSPIFDVSWNLPEAEVAVSGRGLTFLENRRVLFMPSMMEVSEHCVRSIIELRHYLTLELQRLTVDGNIAKSIQAMRTACREFLHAVGPPEDIVRIGGHSGLWASGEFNGSLGELRGVSGVHVARMAGSYGIDIEDELASILPAREDPAATDHLHGHRAE